MSSSMHCDRGQEPGGSGPRMRMFGMGRYRISILNGLAVVRVRSFLLRARRVCAV